MLYIAICDDEPLHLKKAERIIRAKLHSYAPALEAAIISLATEAKRNSGNLVFTSKRAVSKQQTVYFAFIKVVKKFGLDSVRFHDLLHTFAVNSLKAGDDIKTVQKKLGHHTATFTLSTYAHSTSSMEHASANRMNQFIKSVSSQ